MPAPPLRPLPPPTWDVVFPPNTGHGFFQDAAQHPFAANAGAFVPVDSWWLSELSLLAYSPAEAAGSSWESAGLARLGWSLEAIERGANVKGEGQIEP